MMTRFSAAASLAVVTACALQAPQAEPPPAEVGVTPVASTSDTALITLERSPCFGRCPTYRVALTGDGVVTWYGLANVDSVGAVMSRVPPEDVLALAQFIEGVGYFNLDAVYGMGERNCAVYASDAPTVIIAVTLGARSKSVVHDLGCAQAPPELVQIERRIDEVARTRRWIGAELE